MLESFKVVSGSAANLVQGHIPRTGIDHELAHEPADGIAVRYRVTFKHRTNEAEPPRSEEFVARGPSAARAEALRRSRGDEIVVDLVPLG